MITREEIAITIKNEISDQYNKTYDWMHYDERNPQHMSIDGSIDLFKIADRILEKINEQT